MHTRREVKTLTRDGERWIAWAADGAEIASAPVCVLANAHDAARLATLGGRALKRIRGQITRRFAGTCGPLHAVLAGTGDIWCPPRTVWLRALRMIWTTRIPRRAPRAMPATSRDSRKC